MRAAYVLVSNSQYLLSDLQKCATLKKDLEVDTTYAHFVLNAGFVIILKMLSLVVYTLLFWWYTVEWLSDNIDETAMEKTLFK